MESSPGSQKHIPTLDGVRALAVLSVLVFHQIAGISHGTRAQRLFAMAGGFGWAGVDLFFVLSGFLITGILLDARGTPTYYRTFYLRRTVRIFPLYFGYCAVLFLGLPLWYGWSTPEASQLHAAAPWYWTYTLNIRIALENSWSATVAGTAFFWSLAVEEQFYLIWPWVVARLKPRVLLQACVALALTALMLRVALVMTGHTFAAYVLLPARMDSLALGAAVATLARLPRGATTLARLAPFVLAGAVAGLLVLVGVTGYTGWDGKAMATVGYTLLALASAGLVTLAVQAKAGSWMARVLTLRPLRYCGTVSYGMYMFGGVAALLTVTFVPWLGRGGGIDDALTRIVLEVLVVLVLATVSWHLWERPWLRLKERWSYGRKVPPPPVQVPLAPLALGSHARPSSETELV